MRRARWFADRRNLAALAFIILTSVTSAVLISRYQRRAANEDRALATVHQIAQNSQVGAEESNRKIDILAAEILNLRQEVRDLANADSAAQRQAAIDAAAARDAAIAAQFPRPATTTTTTTTTTTSQPPTTTTATTTTTMTTAPCMVSTPPVDSVPSMCVMR